MHPLWASDSVLPTEHRPFTRLRENRGTSKSPDIPGRFMGYAATGACSGRQPSAPRRPPPALATPCTDSHLRRWTSRGRRSAQHAGGGRAVDTLCPRPARDIAPRPTPQARWSPTDACPTRDSRRTTRQLFGDPCPAPLRTDSRRRREAHRSWYTRKPAPAGTPTTAPPKQERPPSHIAVVNTCAIPIGQDRGLGGRVAAWYSLSARANGDRCSGGASGQPPHESYEHTFFEPPPSLCKNEFSEESAGRQRNFSVGGNGARLVREMRRHLA